MMMRATLNPLMSPPVLLADWEPVELFDGRSDEALVVAKRYVEVANHFRRPVSRLRYDPERRFHELASSWRREVKDLSDIDLVCTHPAYQEIIGMGEPALPLILQELRSASDYWFWALKSISGEDPVPEEDRGRVRKMKWHWLRWGDERGYI